MDPNEATAPPTGNVTDALPLTRPLSPDYVYKSSRTSITEPFPAAHAKWDLLEPAAAPHLDAKDFPGTPDEPRTLMKLPPELHMVILQCLDFEDIQQLRRTCKYWHNFATAELLQNIWGREAFFAILVRHCRVCRKFCPKGASRLCTSPLDPGYPLSSRCVTCAVKARDGTFRPGRTITLSNSVEYYVCRWCGWPVTGASGSVVYRQFHRRCYEKYFLGKLMFLSISFTQFFIGIVASALCWRYFRRDKMVLVPTIVGFLLMWAGIIYASLVNRDRACLSDLLLNLVILGLWIAPVYSISQHFMDGSQGRSTQATITFIGLNMLFRLLYVIGSIVLLCRYDWTKHHVPGISIWCRVTGPILMLMIMWTWPHYIELISPRHPLASTGRRRIL
ncbi:hypothetical protein VP1G_00833 [Cytospora mali]|uniref:F-box domain-containing protein n=1 Tax=Cytospora mali TaxID=578113 RepID=A0A194UNI6_CYTMA|nr:hypothetical protein VP1G_00833 [Valsa mali var. pyri (nom. inval.)]